MDAIPPDMTDNSSDSLISGKSYADRLEYFHSRYNNALARSDQFIFVGSGCSIKVMNGALCLQQGSLRGVRNEPVVLYPGIQNIKQIVFLSSSGYLSIDAIHWCSRQGIDIAIIGNDGNLIGSCTPSSSINANLRRLQYRECNTDAGLSIAREIVRKKIDAQIATLKKCQFPYKKTPIRKTVRRNILSAGLDLTDVEDQPSTFHPLWYYLEEEIAQLLHLNSLNAICMLEAQCGVIYWYAFFGSDS